MSLHLYINAIDIIRETKTSSTTLPLDANSYKGIVTGRHKRFKAILHPLSSMTEEHIREVIRLEQSEDSANLAKELSIVNNDCIWYSKYGRSGSRFSCPLRKLFPATTTYLLSKGYNLGILKEGTYKLQPVKAER